MIEILSNVNTCAGITVRAGTVFKVAMNAVALPLNQQLATFPAIRVGTIIAGEVTKIDVV